MTHRTIVGIDDSVGSKKALHWALENARATDSEIIAIHAYETSIAWIDVGSKEAPKMAEHERNHAESVVQRVVADVLAATPGAAVTVTIQAVRGDAATTLLEMGRDADLLVIGSRGRGGFAGVLLGSVSHRVAQHAPCPLVIVPT